MIEQMFQRTDGYVQVNLQPKTGYIACQMFYRIETDSEHSDWKPASVYPSLDGEFVLNGCDYIWNEAQASGTVRLCETKQYALWWNPYLNIGSIQAEVQVKLSFITIDGDYEDIGSVSIASEGVLYFNDWPRYLGEGGSYNPQPGEQKWAISGQGHGSFIWMKVKEQHPAIRVPLPADGEYHIYFGMKHSGLHFLARIDDEPYTRLITSGTTDCLNFSNYQGKQNKEVFWKRAKLRHGCLEISVMQDSVQRDREFGRLSYIKLVPCGAEEAESGFGSVENARTSRIPELILYYEPYSYALHGFHDAETMNEIMLEEFLRLNPHEISCQTVRVGAKSLHWSRIVERMNQSAMDDFNQVNEDSAKLGTRCDILQESSRYLRVREPNVRFTANVGMNRPYLWNPGLSDTFTNEHRDYVKNGDFDYAIPEVRDYAKSILFELIDNYDIDGIVLDYMRNYLNQSVDSLTDLCRDVKRRLDEKGRQTGKTLELKVRIPAEQIVYYKSMKLCVAERLVDGIIPSNHATAEPLPPVEHYQQLCKGTGVKVYGCIDGWRWILGHHAKTGILRMAHSPESINRYIEHYTKLGVDGIFVYQGDQVTGNPYLFNLFR
ncbi:hypothetical protein [Paenibacillus ginsengarvi]|uniref:Glycosyl hydrolase-like 10 domain-containing protein n=1 Tax=Paenibacillus ginsengarvi TaxID=400777 RepID=A0A3B0CC90_9BACL|nr:hypothetical protein [Paenibacillus ginsengarvi]RKN82154.1 hypothetical protein D7M11_17515 [Paenibacillus ginsengarvi]